jgi:hypothetical protein
MPTGGVMSALATPARNPSLMKTSSNQFDKSVSGELVITDAE